MAKAPLITTQTDVPGTHVRPPAQGVASMLGGSRRATKTPPKPEAIEPLAEPAAVPPQVESGAVAAPTTRRAFGPRTDIRLDREDHRELERLLDVLEDKFGWRPKRTEAGEALFLMLLHAEPAFKMMADVTPTTRPAYHSQDRREGLAELAAFLNRGIRDARALTT